MQKRNCDYCGRPYEFRMAHSRFCSSTCRAAYSNAIKAPFVAALQKELSALKQTIVENCCEELAAHEQNMAALRETLISRYPGLLDDLSEFFD